MCYTSSCQACPKNVFQEQKFFNNISLNKNSLNNDNGNIKRIRKNENEDSVETVEFDYTELLLFLIKKREFEREDLKLNIDLLSVNNTLTKNQEERLKKYFDCDIIIKNYPSNANKNVKSKNKNLFYKNYNGMIVYVYGLPETYNLNVSHDEDCALENKETSANSQSKLLFEDKWIVSPNEDFMLHTCIVTFNLEDKPKVINILTILCFKNRKIFSNKKIEDNMMKNIKNNNKQLLNDKFGKDISKHSKIKILNKIKKIDNLVSKELLLSYENTIKDELFDLKELNMIIDTYVEFANKIAAENSLYFENYSYRKIILDKYIETPLPNKTIFNRHFDITSNLNLLEKQKEYDSSNKLNEEYCEDNNLCNKQMIDISRKNVFSDLEQAYEISKEKTLDKYLFAATYMACSSFEPILFNKYIYSSFESFLSNKHKRGNYIPLEPFYVGGRGTIKGLTHCENISNLYDIQIVPFYEVPEKRKKECINCLMWSEKNNAYVNFMRNEYDENTSITNLVKDEIWIKITPKEIELDGAKMLSNNFAESKFIIECILGFAINKSNAEYAAKIWNHYTKCLSNDDHDRSYYVLVNNYFNKNDKNSRNKKIYNGFTDYKTESFYRTFSINSNGEGLIEYTIEYSVNWIEINNEKICTSIYEKVFATDGQSTIKQYDQSNLGDTKLVEYIDSRTDFYKKTFTKKGEIIKKIKSLNKEKNNRTWKRFILNKEIYNKPDLLTKNIIDGTIYPTCEFLWKNDDKDKFDIFTYFNFGCMCIVNDPKRVLKNELYWLCNDEQNTEFKKITASNPNKDKHIRSSLKHINDYFRKNINFKREEKIGFNLFHLNPTMLSYVDTYFASELSYNGDLLYKYLQYRNAEDKQNWYDDFVVNHIGLEGEDAFIEKTYKAVEYGRNNNIPIDNLFHGCFYKIVNDFYSKDIIGSNEFNTLNALEYDEAKREGIKLYMKAVKSNNETTKTSYNYNKFTFMKLYDYAIPSFALVRNAFIINDLVDFTEFYKIKINTNFGYDFFDYNLEEKNDNMSSYTRANINFLYNTTKTNITGDSSNKILEINKKIVSYTDNRELINQIRSFERYIIDIEKKKKKEKVVDKKAKKLPTSLWAIFIAMISVNINSLIGFLIQLGTSDRRNESWFPIATGAWVFATILSVIVFIIFYKKFNPNWDMLFKSKPKRKNKVNVNRDKYLLIIDNIDTTKESFENEFLPLLEDKILYEAWSFKILFILDGVENYINLKDVINNRLQAMHTHHKTISYDHNIIKTSDTEHNLIRIFREKIYFSKLFKGIPMFPDDRDYLDNRLYLWMDTYHGNEIKIPTSKYITKLEEIVKFIIDDLKYNYADFNNFTDKLYINCEKDLKILEEYKESIDIHFYKLKNNISYDELVKYKEDKEYLNLKLICQNNYCYLTRQVIITWLNYRSQVDGWNIDFDLNDNNTKLYEILTKNGDVIKSLKLRNIKVELQNGTNIKGKGKNNKLNGYIYDSRIDPNKVYCSLVFKFDENDENNVVI